jgi:subtilisin family serine protease
LAAGNGTAIASRKYAGVAPEADLVIVKITSEGAPAHGSSPAETAFNGCVTDALDWVDAKITELGQPAVALWNAGSQWGPIDGSSASSLVINRYFPPDSPGRIWVATSGDEGGLPNHAGADFGPDAPAEFTFTLTGDNSYPSAWFSGGPASVTITLSDGTVLGPFAERDTPDAVNGVTGYIYEPGAEFDPWTSTSGDHAVYMRILGHAGDTGTIKFEASGAGHVDVYGDVLGPEPLTSSINFEEAQLVPGRVSDVASTEGVIVTGVHVALDSFVNMNGATQSFSTEGLTGELWYRSSGGPTRDGRDVVDVTAAGQNVPASIGAGSWWSDDSFRHLWPQDGEGKYIRFGGTSAAGPIVVGTIALMLQANPTLTTEQARELLHATASADSFTGAVPNSDWGYGKLDITAAVAAAGQ